MVALAGRSGGRADLCADHSRGAGAGRLPACLVYPGMEIHQGSNVCTLGFVDPGARTAFTAGHCRGDGPVVDRDGNPIGALTMFRDNTPDGATVATDHMISDWEAISLAPDVARERRPARRPRPGVRSEASCRRLAFRCVTSG